MGVVAQIQDIDARLGPAKLETLSRAQLQAVAADRGLRTTGTRAVLVDRVSGSVRRDIAGLRARGLADVAAVVGRSLVRGSVQIDLLAGPEHVLHATRDLDGDPVSVAGVRMTLRFLRNGIDVTPPDFNPWTVINPPLLVEDPVGEIDLGPAAGGRYREDPAAAIREVVLQKARELVGL